MRTSLMLDEALVREARKRALEEGRTFSGLVEVALREYLRSRWLLEEVPARRFTLPTYGGATITDLSPETIAELRDDGP